MSEVNEIKNNVKKYYSSTLNVAEENIGIKLERIGGLSNRNYRVYINDLSKNKRIGKVFYRKFGELSKSVNLELEEAIIEYLAKRGFGPKLLVEVPLNYRITELIENSITIPKEETFDEKFLEKLYNILNIFTSISYTYKYEINGDKISLDPISKNQYENCLDWLERAKKNFKKFLEQFEQKYSKEKNPKEWADVEMVQNYLDNFKEYFSKKFSSTRIFCAKS